MGSGFQSADPSEDGPMFAACLSCWQDMILLEVAEGKYKEEGGHTENLTLRTKGSGTPVGRVLSV